MVKFSLAFALVASLFLNVLFGLMLMSRHQSNDGSSDNSFTFVWGPDKQRIVNGELRLEMDFKWVGGNLSIMAKINDMSLDGYLGLVFDRNRNGIIDRGAYDRPFMLLKDNKTYGRAYLVYDEYGLPYGAIIPDSATPLNWAIESPWHRCTFDNATGYTFKVNLPRDMLNPENNIVFVSYSGGCPNTDDVFVMFEFEVTYP